MLLFDYCVFCILILEFYPSWLVIADSLNPRRPPNEEAFWKLGHHERATTIENMQEKIKKIKDRRNQKPWDLSNPRVIAALNASSAKRPNLLLILADDLGYGDLSVAPFTHPPDRSFPCGEGGILSPQLEKMAANGVTMVNFHSASPVCSPSRVAIMTSLYPWRLGAMNAFELGRDMSQRNGFLPQVPTGAEMLREAGYYTAHSGKWHLGGMREEMRLDRTERDQCSRGSPNQHGFEEYVSELDGPESPRYTFLLRNSILHSKGHRHLLRDDVPVPISAMENLPPGSQYTLSDREAEDAIEVMRTNQKTRPGQPWFIQVWFNAPHGPWETLQSGEEVYRKSHNTVSLPNLDSHKCLQPYSTLRESKFWQYKTMVTAMDKSIGKLLDALRELGEEENTIVVFTSDNGPEAGAGTPGPHFKERKRSLMEGGVRVPAIWQWKGHFPAGTVLNDFAGTIDIMPTMLEAAGVTKPKEVSWDGLSLLELLKTAGSAERHRGHHVGHSHSTHSHSSHNLKQDSHRQLNDININISNANANNISTNLIVEVITPSNATSPLLGTPLSKFGEDKLRSRVFLWHKDTDSAEANGPTYQSGGYFDDVKIITTERRGCLFQVYDLRHDPYENRNLVDGMQGKFIRPSNSYPCPVRYDTYQKVNEIEKLIDKRSAHAHCVETQGTTGNVELCMSKYHMSVVTKIQVILPKLVALVKHGQQAHQNYLNKLNRREINAQCPVPIVSEIKPLLFEDSPGCFSRYDCSVPEY